MNAISVGEVLWDVVGTAEYLGGGAFNFAVHLARLGHEISFVSAVGNDERGEKILNEMSTIGLSSRYVHSVEAHPTGIVTVSLDEAGIPNFLIHRPAAYDFTWLSEPDFAELFSRPVDWIYFGTLFQMSPQAKRLTMRLLESGRASRRFYDINLRTNNWEASLVRELMGKASIIKMNADEVVEVARLLDQPPAPLDRFCRACAAKLDLEGICVTRGADGCALLLGEEYVEQEGYQVRVVDTVGAGDAFAAACLHGIASGWPAARVADFANRVGALVSSRRGGVPPWTVAEVETWGTSTKSSC